MEWIKNLKVGDEVYSYNNNTNKIEVGKVERIFNRSS